MSSKYISAKRKKNQKNVKGLFTSAIDVDTEFMNSLLCVVAFFVIFVLFQHSIFIFLWNLIKSQAIDVETPKISLQANALPKNNRGMKLEIAWDLWKLLEIGLKVGEFAAIWFGFTIFEIFSMVGNIFKLSCWEFSSWNSWSIGKLCINLWYHFSIGISVTIQQLIFKIVLK